MNPKDVKFSRNTLSNLLLIVLIIVLPQQGFSQELQVSSQPNALGFPLVGKNNTATLVIDSLDHAGVKIALGNLQKDISLVTDKTPNISFRRNGEHNVFIGSLDHSSLIQNLIKEYHIDVSAIQGKWEAYIITTLPGKPENMIVIGSDKRGTIFGIYELSKQIGVSPWNWWADVPTTKKKQLYIKADGVTDSGPKVQYRGIFINDEAPALSGWVFEKYGGFNHQFYEHVFELILRLKGNFLWPAMWGRAFYDDDSLNPVLADKYGVVISTSHHEPLMRAHDEWRRYGKGDWNYNTNPENLRAFWKKGMERMGTNESLVTIGMRGDGDEPMTEGTAIELLEGIVKDQRTIIEEVTGKPAAETPQVWALYKEVQDYYDQGMRVPDDVTLLISDDNWGNIRKLPNPTEKPRKGGYGIYYHYDYVGGPRSYKWINVTQISRVYEQMSLAYAYNARKIWIVNVGDIKPMEYPISFFLDYAWNPEKFGLEELKKYPEMWAKEQFGETYSKEIANLLQAYTTINSRRTPELLNDETYSLNYYNEAEGILSEVDAMESRADSIGALLGPKYQSAYYQLVLYPVKAVANLHRMYIAQAKNKQLALQGQEAANVFAKKVKEYFAIDKQLTQKYHELESGKWNHFMDQTHIGYRFWNDPKENILPRTETVTPQITSAMGISVPDSQDYYPMSKNVTLPPFDSYHTTVSFEIFNRGTTPFEYRILKAPKWLSVSQTKGLVNESAIVTLRVNPKKTPKSAETATFTVIGNGDTALITAIYAPFSEKPSGFIEYNGLVSIEAIHFKNGTGWEIIPDLGRNNVAIRPQQKFISTISDKDRLTYEFTLKDEGERQLIFLTSPTLDFLDKGGLQFAYSIDNGPVSLLNIQKDTKDNWDETVRNNVIRVETKLPLTAGKHELHIYAKDPGVVLQEIIIEKDGKTPTYLAPPESKTAN